MSSKLNREHKTNGLAKGPVYFHAPPIKTAFAVRLTEDYSLQYPKRFSARGGAIPLGGTDVGQ